MRHGDRFAVNTVKQFAQSPGRAAAIVAERAAQSKSAAMQAQVDAAGVALSEQAAEIDRLTHVQKLNTRTFYVQNPAANVACLSADRLRAIADSDTAVTAASTTQ